MFRCWKQKQLNLNLWVFNCGLKVVAESEVVQLHIIFNPYRPYSDLGFQTPWVWRYDGGPPKTYHQGVFMGCKSVSFGGSKIVFRRARSQEARCKQMSFAQLKSFGCASKTYSHLQGGPLPVISRVITPINRVVNPNYRLHKAIIRGYNYIYNWKGPTL